MLTGDVRYLRGFSLHSFLQQLDVLSCRSVCLHGVNGHAAVAVQQILQTQQRVTQQHSQHSYTHNTHLFLWVESRPKGVELSTLKASKGAGYDQRVSWCPGLVSKSAVF